MNKYTQAIIAFSIVLPIMGLILLIGLELGITGYFGSEAAQRKSDWDDHLARLQQISQIDKSIDQKKDEDNRNITALDGDVKLKLTQSLATIGEHLGSNDLQVTDSSITDGTEEWSSYKKAQAKTGNFKIDSRYETLQTALTGLEVEQPELILQSVSIETLQRKDTEPALEATIMYQAWSSPSGSSSSKGNKRP